MVSLLPREFISMHKPTAHQLAMIRQIYFTIVEEPWFNRNAVTERELLKVVFRVCLGEGGHQGRLAQLCREQARQRFSRPD